MLNQTSEYLTITDVDVFHRGDRDTPAVSMADTVIPKHLISLIAIPDREHEAPMKRYNAKIQKTAFEAVVLVPGFAIRGRLHLQKIPDDSKNVLERDLGTFFPLTNANITGGIEVKAPTVFVNKSFVYALHVAPYPLAEPDSAGAGNAVSKSEPQGVTRQSQPAL